MLQKGSLSFENSEIVLGSGASVSIDEFRLYSRQLTGNEILALYKTPGIASGSTIITGYQIVTGIIKSKNYVEDVSGVKINLITGDVEINSDSWHYVGEVDQPSFQNSWENYSATQKLRFFKNSNNTITINGSVKNGTYTDGTIIFILPSTYRPSQDNWFIGYGTSSTNYFRILIDTSGNIKVYDLTGNTIVNIDINFSLK